VRNLERIAPGDGRGDASVDRVFDHYARYWYELFRLPHDDLTRLDARVDVHGFEHLEAAAAQHRGLLLALPHLGNWDLAGAWLASKGFAITAVAEPADPPELFDWFVETRARVGIQVIPLGGDAGSAVLRALGDDRVVCLVCDRDITGDGVPVTFFGERTRLPGGPALLALRTGTPLLPVGLSFLPDGRQGIRILEPLPSNRQGRLRDDVARVTQQLADVFEDLIRAAPDQWLMMQPNWPSDIGASR
ncbi:MAG TPA: phosphatidylinositol mannoside acyltransferase, partial [Acidimicrobiia bacterium]|nr:phosphatidylinositol mannoside acyltransferase [Acidimicrobiia bacterium]